MTTTAVKKPEEGKYYEIIGNKFKDDNYAYHRFEIGRIVRCVYSSKNTSTFSAENSTGKKTTQNIRNHHVIPAEEGFVSIWS